MLVFALLAVHDPRRKTLTTCSGGSGGSDGGGTGGGGGGVGGVGGGTGGGADGGGITFTMDGADSTVMPSASEAAAAVPRVDASEVCSTAAVVSAGTAMVAVMVTLA